MKFLVSLFLLLFFHLQTYSQYCNSAGPTTLIDSNLESVELIGDSNTLNFIGCPGVLGLDDQTNLSVSLGANNTYTIDVQFGTCGGNYSGIGEVWIDFNQDNIFDISESIGTWSGTPPTNLSTFIFTVPINSINGITRMRIIQREGGILPIDPCGAFQWGSATDFSILISGGVDCSGYIGNTMNDPIIVGTLPYANTMDNSYCYFNNNNAYPSPDVFFLLTADPSLLHVNVSLCGATFDTFLSVFDKFGNTIAYNDDSPNCGNQSETSFNLEGRDSVYIIVEGWGNESGEFDIAINGQFLGLNEESENKVKIFPNPSTGIFHLEGITSQKIKIYTLEGKMINTTEFKSGTALDLQHLPDGLYLLHYFKNGQQQKHSIIIH